jgi:uncharacterized RDD family membrane protein YckC
MKTATLQIRTPEGIVFSHQLAGPVIRFVAWAVDFMCVLALVMASSALLILVQVVSSGFGAALSTVSYFVISVGYGIACEWAWRGQTLGKRLMRLRVVDAEGMRLQFNQIVTRNLLRFVDSLPATYLIGGIVCWFNSKCQRLGDIAANTIVIRIPCVSEPDLDQLLVGKFNSLRQYPHLAARLRQNVSPTEAAVALQAVLRRDELEPVARVELFADLSTHLRAKVEFPAEATDGIADEQYVRNVVDVLYRTRTDNRVDELANR